MDQELSDDEVGALVTLARYVMRADGRVSQAERQSMIGIGRAVGMVRFSDALQRIEDKPLDGTELLRLARTFDGGQTRMAAFRMLAELAASDGIAESEQKLLDALAATWGIDWSAE